MGRYQNKERLHAECPYTHAQLVEAATEINSTKPSAQYHKTSDHKTADSRLRLGMNFNPSKDENPATFTIAEDGGDYTLSVVKNTDSTQLITDDLVMRMASVARLRVAPHSLIKSSDGVLMHIVEQSIRGKRRAKLQVTPLLPSLPKGSGTYHCEVIARSLSLLSTTPKLECVSLFELLYFCWMVGDLDFNVDRMRMSTSQDGFTTLAPATHLTSQAIIETTRHEDFKVLINDKRSDVTNTDFIESMLRCGLERKIAENVVSKFAHYIDPWCDMIEECGLSEEIAERFKFRLFLKS